MPQFYDGIPEFSQTVKALIPEEWLSVIWPRYKIFTYRCFEEGFRGHPLLIPRPVFGAPERDVPMMYYLFTLDLKIFAIGCAAGIYIALKHGYTTNDMKFEISKHIYFDANGMEVGGTRQDWIQWMKMDRWKLYAAFKRTFNWAIWGGFTHSWNYYCFRTLACAHGHFIPMLGTAIMMTAPEYSFIKTHRTVLKCGFYVIIYDVFHYIFLSGHFTFFTYPIMLKFVVNPGLTIFHPFSWIRPLFPR